MYAVILVMISLMVSSVESTAYRDCPSNQGAIGHATSFELSPCTSEPCNFKHGETVNVKITFTAGNDSNTLKSTVYGYVVGIPVLFPLPNSNACNNSGITCPIKKGQTYTYNSSFQVLNTYPQITIVVMWRLDGATSNEVCFNFPMSINDNPELIRG